MGVKFDFSDVEDFLNSEDEAVGKIISDVGEEAVKYAYAKGTYHNITWTLRRSNKFIVDKEGLMLYNDATSINGKADINFSNIAPDALDIVTGGGSGKVVQYASFVEARGKNVLGSAALFAEKQLRDKLSRK